MGLPLACLSSECWRSKLLSYAWFKAPFLPCQHWEGLSWMNVWWCPFAVPKMTRGDTDNLFIHIVNYDCSYIKHQLTLGSFLFQSRLNNKPQQAKDWKINTKALSERESSSVKGVSGMSSALTRIWLELHSSHYVPVAQATFGGDIWRYKLFYQEQTWRGIGQQ